MRCAACGHRWTLDYDDDLVLEVPAPPEAPAPPPVSTPPPPPETPPEANTTIESPVPEDARDSGAPWLRTLVAVVVGGALAVGAAGLWVARIDPERLPVLGDDLARLAPQPLPLEITFTARVSALPSGDRLLEIDGIVRNTGPESVILPDLVARLASPDGTVRRWRIAPPVASLAPGAGARFTSTATGFPADATRVGIRPAR
jgi:hypothetical protein